MSRKFCVTIYKALASPTGRRSLWTRPLSSYYRSGSISPAAVRPVQQQQQLHSIDERAICCLSPSPESDTNKRRRSCCVSLARVVWRKHSFRRKQATVVQQHLRNSKAAAKAAHQAPPLGKPFRRGGHGQLRFRVCRRRRVMPIIIRSSTTCTRGHLWRRSSSLLNMVPLFFLRNRIL